MTGFILKLLQFKIFYLFFLKKKVQKALAYKVYRQIFFRFSNMILPRNCFFFINQGFIYIHTLGMKQEMEKDSSEKQKKTVWFQKPAIPRH